MTKAYDAVDFTAEAVNTLLTEVRNGVADNTLDLNELIIDLQKVRSHITHLLGGLYDRVEELEPEDEEDDDD
jgi:hypothetical protein